MVVLWNLQALGRSTEVLSSVKQKAEQAYQHAMFAQTALAENKFKNSEEEFKQATFELQEAQRELEEALSVSKKILEVIDVTGTVRSGTNLLIGGEELAKAGQHASKAASILFNSSELIQGKGKDGKTLVDALEIAKTELTMANNALIIAERNINNVNSTFLPKDVKQQVKKLSEVIPKIRKPLTSFLNQGDLLLEVLGAKHDRNYLLLFENNYEIRPTGGFIGSVGLVNIDRGSIENIDVQTVYDPDGQLKEYISPPEPLRKITDRWYLRDANWFVDYDVSARKIASFFEKEGGASVDGVIAITPEVIKALLEVTGPIEVPGYDITVDSNNFVELTQDQVTYFYDRKENKPKKFLADLTPLLLNKVLKADSGSTLKVLGIFGRMIQQKQILIYLTDAEEQESILKNHWNGAFPKDAKGFLAVNNANIGGHKSDQFIKQEIDYRTVVEEDGDVEVVVTIRRTHNGPTEKLPLNYPDGENPAYKDNVIWQRVLIPREAQLVEARGFSSSSEVSSLIKHDSSLKLSPDPDVAEWQRVQSKGVSNTVIGEEAGYKYFANWMITKPGATTVGLYRYRLTGSMSLPTLFHSAKTFEAYIAKQPGDVRTDIRYELTLPKNTRIVHTVPNDGITKNSKNSLVYRGKLNSDKIIGVVIESK